MSAPLRLTNYTIRIGVIIKGKAENRATVDMRMTGGRLNREVLSLRDYLLMRVRIIGYSFPEKVCSRQLLHPRRTTGKVHHQREKVYSLGEIYLSVKKYTSYLKTNGISINIFIESIK